MTHYDAIIIGAGQAGSPLAKKLAKAGKKTCLIEKRFIGGTCINDGCTPTKALVASAKAAHQSITARQLGVEIGDVAVNFKAIKARKDKIVNQFRSGSQKGLEATENLTLIFGDASFSGEKEITITYTNGGRVEQITGDWIFINTGTSNIVPEIEGLEKIDFLTSTTLLDQEELPESLVILGGSYIALEFGQMFQRFGSKVTILERSERIMSREDEDISKSLTDILTDEGISIMTSTGVERFNTDEKGMINTQIKTISGTQVIKSSHLLFAIGRSPQTKTLGLENCGVEVDEKGFVKVNDKLETNIPGIYALGDVNGGPAFTHISYNDYIIIYQNLIEGKNASTKDRPLPYCVFTDPQLGRIGISETEAKDKGLNFKVVTLPMANVARGIETGETLGFMKAVVDCIYQ